MADEIYPIGVFDSGVGGLSVLRAIWKELPLERTIYLADQTHVPYGIRSLDEVRSFSNGITQFFLSFHVKLIVIACNTASAAALNWLRRIYPQTTFVGMEPAVKPAAETTQTGAVCVLATPATFQGALYASVVERFASNVKIYQRTCPDLVPQIELGLIDDAKTRQILENALLPLLNNNIDKIVLGCTHYPFVIPVIQEIVGDSVNIIDPAPAIARQVHRVLKGKGLLVNNSSQRDKKFGYFTTGNPQELEGILFQLLGIKTNVEKANWRGSKLYRNEN